jgi:uncharacterized small protein (DUF1192 family)
MADVDEEQVFGRRPPKSLPTHAIGQILDDLSATELAERIGLLKAEIARLEQAIEARQATRSAASAVFKA